MHRPRLGYGAGYKLAGGSVSPIDAPAGGESLRRNGVFLHGELPGQIGLAPAGVELIAGHGAKGSKTHVLIVRS